MNVEKWLWDEPICRADVETQTQRTDFEYFFYNYYSSFRILLEFLIYYSLPSYSICLSRFNFSILFLLFDLGFPCSSVGKESACSAVDPGLIPGSRRSPEEGNGNPLQYPCLENLMDRGSWWAVVHGVAKSWAQLSD